MELVSVAALAENGVIGREGELPWPSIPADKRQYRERAAGSPVILGRRTFESMRDDLPGARQIVVSRSLDSVDEPTAAVADGVDAALDRAREIVGDAPDPVDGAGAGDGDATGDVGDDAVYVLGGATIYELFQPHVDRLVLSHVRGEYEGDSRFPAFDEDDWTVVSEEPHDRFVLREWVRADGPRSRR